jgi:transcriptional regulator GlxA family with amidase domain
MAEQIAILLFDGVEELDAVGPYEVLAHWTRTFPGDGYEVACLSPGGRAVTAAKGLVIGAHAAVEEAAAPSVVLHPGGEGTRALIRDAPWVDRLRAWRAETPLMTSVCTGSLVYAAAGLLHRRPATTYWDHMGLLGTLDPSIDLRPDARFVDDGDVITSAGVSAGIDMALHLVSRLAGVDRARAVRRGIQYDPEPPV